MLAGAAWPRDTALPLDPGPPGAYDAAVTRTRIKICGISRVEDALAATDAGADAIGLIFHPPARRRVTWEQARAICSALPPFVTPVALFVDARPDVIRQTLHALPIRHVQLHGSERPDDLAELSEFRLIKAIRVERDSFEEDLSAWARAIAGGKLTHLQGLVLETGGQDAPGGTGVANDWPFIRGVMEAGAFSALPAIIAAGGLTPDSVGEVVRALRPYAVDVSSGVETNGVKSADRIRAFVDAVNDADTD